MSLRNLVLAITVFGIFTLYLGCDNERVAGSTTTENTDKPKTVTGCLVKSNGKPAKQVSVHIRPQNTLAESTGFSSLMKISADTITVTTDDSGYYSIDTGLIDAGIYVIEGNDGSGNLVLIDSVAIQDPEYTVEVPEDTLKPAGALKGVIKLSEGGDPRKVFVLAFGLDRFARVETDGSFKFEYLAESDYDLRILSTIDDYGVLDTVDIPVISADTTDLDTLELPFEGIPIVKNLNLEYDTLMQVVTLTWAPADSELVKGYYVYRMHSDSDFVKINTSLITDTTYRDSSAVQDQSYEYKIVAVDPDDNEGEKWEGVLIDISGGYAISDTLIQITGKIGNFIQDKHGNIFLINHSENKIMSYDSSGNFTREWEISGGLMQSYEWVRKIAMNDSIHLFLANRNTASVQQYDTLGNLISSYGLGNGALCVGLEIEGDTILFANGENSKIFSINRNGDTLFTIGKNWDPSIVKLWSMTVDGSANIYIYGEFGQAVAEKKEGIRVFNRKGDFLYEISADYGSANISINNEKILLATKTHVFCFELDGSSIFKFQLPFVRTVPPMAQFNSNGQILLNDPKGRLLVFKRL